MGFASDDRRSARIITLDADGLDALELVLIGARSLNSLLDELALGREPLGEVLLHDSENTPVACIREGSIAPLRPLPGGVGPQWDPAVRRGPREVRDENESVERATVALALFSPPSLADVEKAQIRVNEVRAHTLILAAFVSRGRRLKVDDTKPRVSPNGVVRATLAAAEELSRRLPRTRVVTLAIPWPLRLLIPRAAREGEIRDILASYGASSILIGGDKPRLDDKAADQLYPVASRREFTDADAETRYMPTTIFFTGLSGSGKSTVARALAEHLLDTSSTEIVLLDGDEMRRRVSQDLGFDRASRNTNVARIAEAAAHVAKNGGIAIAAPIAPFADGRARAREIASAAAPFLLVHISTPLEICEARDRKGLYAKARSGEIAEFTGISSPYETPNDADLVIDTSVVSVEDAVTQIVKELKRLSRS
jgi:sulfate adenylyltransferase